MESRNERKCFAICCVVKEIMFVLSGQAHNRDADNKLLIKDPLAYIKSSNKNLQNTSVLFFLLLLLRHFISFQRHDFLQLFIPVLFLHFIQLNSQLNLAKTVIKINFLLVFFYFFERQTRNKRVLLCGSYKKNFILFNTTMEFCFLCHRTGNKNVT